MRRTQAGKTPLPLARRSYHPGVDQLLNTTEAARQLHVSAETLRRWDRQGRVSEGVYEITAGGHRKWRADRIMELESLIGSGPTEAAPHAPEVADLQAKVRDADLEQQEHAAALVSESKLVLALGVAVALLGTLFILGTWISNYNSTLNRLSAWHASESASGWALPAIVSMQVGRWAALLMAIAGIGCVVLAARSAAKGEGRGSLWLSRYVLLVISGASCSFATVAIWSIVPPLKLDYGPSWLGALAERLAGGSERLNTPEWMISAGGALPVVFVVIIHVFCVLLTWKMITGIPRAFLRSAQTLADHLAWRWSVIMGTAGVAERPKRPARDETKPRMMVWHRYDRWG